MHRVARFELLFDDEVPCMHPPGPLIPGSRVVWHVPIPLRAKVDIMFFLDSKWTKLGYRGPCWDAQEPIQPFVALVIKAPRR